MAKNKGGRPPIPIDMEELEKLAAMQCTASEIAAWFNCTRETIQRRLNKPEYRDTLEKGRGKGMVSLRRTQFRLAETNAGMAIFLGKNYLGQSDKTETVHSGSLDLKGIMQELDGKTTDLDDDSHRGPQQTIQ